MLRGRSDYLCCSIQERFQYFVYVLFVVLLLLSIFCNCYKLLYFVYLKLIVTPHPVHGTGPLAQGIDSEPLVEAGFRFLQQAHFLEGLLFRSATGSSKKLRPRRLNVTAVGLGTYYPWIQGHICIRIIYRV
jgi:hypothetical protein